MKTVKAWPTASTGPDALRTSANPLGREAVDLDVEVRRGQAQERVAHGAADQKGPAPGRAQRIEDADEAVGKCAERSRATAERSTRARRLRRVRSLERLDHHVEAALRGLDEERAERPGVETERRLAGSARRRGPSPPTRIGGRMPPRTIRCEAARRETRPLPSSNGRISTSARQGERGLLRSPSARPPLRC